ncbi:MAG: methyltransferase domain-containing protein [Planctomycetaceae bacterium]|nr:methyltransferase domain-containing protein [Planctomycetaceae bacterium]
MSVTASPAARRWTIGRRQRIAELMDDPQIEPAALDHALRGIARINAVSLTAEHLWRRLKRIAAQRRLSRLSVLDVGCGNADVTIGIARRAASAGLRVEISGCDMTAVAIEAASDRARRAGLRNVEFFQADALLDDLRGEYDAVVSSLFLHHLAEQDAIELLRRASQIARYAIIMDDLCRSALGYWLARWGCRLLTRSPVVHFDGPASVRSAFTATEALQLARAAGLDGALAVRRWPERYTLAWHANAEGVS